jgi:uncharacterized protein (TIGR00730 family)
VGYLEFEARMARLRSICVYCGSRTGTDPALKEAAATFGRLSAQAGIRLVYGGGRVGLMGVVADAALAAGGEVVGIIPEHLNSIEIGHQNVTELRIVPNMHERKQLMFEMSDAFVILPGGIGTLDEAFEIITWRQLHLHDKPVIVVDAAGYWRPFLDLIDHIIAQGFASAAIRRLFRVVGRVEDVIPALEAAPAPREPERAERF